MTRKRSQRAAVLLASAMASVSSFARADGPYEGDWRAGPMRIEVAVESWGVDCGPQPQSTAVPGGGIVRVTQSGDDLTFHGRPSRSTRGCWSENQAVRRVSARYQSGTWTIVCRTPDDDPRTEVGTYTLRAVGSDRLEFRDVSRYEWRLNASRCLATITSSQTFERVLSPPPQPDSELSSPRQTEPTSASRGEQVCVPGAPARISIRPAQSVIGPGGRVCFQVRVVDANGCPLPGVTPVLEVRGSRGARGELRGTCFQAAGNAADSEGEFTVVARNGALEGQARVRVGTPDLSDLIALRAAAGGAVSVADEGRPMSDETARVAARSEVRRPAPWWPIAGALFGVVLVVIAILGFILRNQRRSRGPEAESPHPGAVGGSEGTSKRPSTAPASTGSSTPLDGSPRICPSCRRGYPPEATRCTVDGTRLVAYREFVATQSGGETTKVCPTCGTRYPGTIRFCGKDGATLVDG